VPFAVLPIDLTLFHEIERPQKYGQILFVTGDLIHAQARDQRFGLHPPNLRAPVRRLAQGPAIVKPTVGAVVAMLERIAHQRFVEIEQRIV
jgi:hypothetical protein